MLKTPIVPQIERNFKEKIIKSQEMMPHIQFSDTKKNSMMMNKNIPIAIYNSCMSPNQSNRDFSVKIANSNNGRIDMNKAFQFSPFQQNINNKMFQSQNMKNSYSDLRTSASFNSQNSFFQIIITNLSLFQIILFYSRIIFINLIEGFRQLITRSIYKTLIFIEIIYHQKN